MPFFEPLPPEPPEPSHHWAPPAWDRAADGVLPATLAVDAVVHRSEQAVIAVDTLKVYPNGFVIDVVILLDPRTAHERLGMMGLRPGARRMPRLGVRFSDGRSAGQGDVGFGGRMNTPKDEDGFPTGIWMQHSGGGGGGGGWRFGAWVYPLPPEGPVEIFVGLPALGLDEASVTVEGAAIREAANRAVVVWE